jgi:lipopolysaccharide transport system ATP-binding protein
MYASDPVAIRVENLSKKYVITIGSRESFREALTDALVTPFMRVLGRPSRVQESLLALNGISFEIPRGEVVGIIGRNGAGKSTLLKILSRITEPTSGRAEVRGRVASLLEVGTGFHSELTGRENIYLNGAIIGMTRAEIRSKFDQIVAFAELDKFIDTPLKRYSSGMYVRLAFAVASHLTFDILLLDEVLAVGDIAFQEKCFKSMENTTRRGRTIIVVSHNLHTIKRLCTRAIFLQRGCLIQDGEVNNVVQVFQNEILSSKTVASTKTSNGILSKDNGLTDVFIERIQLLDADLNEAENLGTWDPLLVRIFYKSHSDIEYATAEVHITSPDGVCLMKCMSYGDRNDRLSLKAGGGYIDFTMEKIELAAGRYELGVGLAKAGRPWLCFVRMPLEIAERDVYRSGFPPTVAQQYVAPEFRWVAK